MKSRVSLASAALLAVGLPAAAAGAQEAPGASYPPPGGATAPDEPAGTGPRGSSQPAAGERRFDEVGYASIGSGEGVSASVPGLTPGSYAEVTAIDTGRTILVAVTGEGVAPGRVALLSRAAAAGLAAAGDRVAVRIRPVVPTGPDIATLRGGGAIVDRGVAPPALLAALRRKLGSPPIAARPAPVRPVRAPLRPQAATRRGLEPGYYVQVIALANAARAAELAAKIGGVTEPAGAVTRVHLGPFASQNAALAGRANALRLGYPGAQIVRIIP